MIAYAGMLLEPARQAKMKVPQESMIDERDLSPLREHYPHFFVYCMLQLGQPMPYPTAHWENAKVVAGFSEADVRCMTPEQFVKAGFDIGYTIP